MEEKIFDGMRYLIDYPDDFSPDKKYPLANCTPESSDCRNQQQTLTGCFIKKVAAGF